MGNACLQFDLKQATLKYHSSNFLYFFKQSVTKSMGKTAICIILYFYPLPALKNVNKQWAILVSSYVMGWQHCKWGEGEVQTHFLKFP